MPGISQGGPARAPSLRVLPSQGVEGGFDGGDAPAQSDERPALRLVKDDSSLLVAGADPARREALLAELAQTMPEGTPFAQASTLTEVLEHAPRSRMVILSGGLDDASASSLMRVLGRRHPRLPVITVGAADPGDA